MKIEELKKYKKILLLGFGKEGKSTFNFLQHAHPAAQIGIADQMEGPDYLAKQHGYDLVIKTPGIPKRLVMTPYTTAANIFFANSKGKIIGVTGSKGKSTTASLIYAILKEAGFSAGLVGNIGNPALGALLHYNGADIFWVYELSSYNLDDLKYSPYISIFLNFFPDHMDYHGGLEAYWRAKTNIVTRAGSRDFLVYNPDSPPMYQLAISIEARAVPFIKTLPFPPETVPLIGRHNLENVRAAITAAELLKIPAEVIERAVKKFEPLPHRLERVGEFDGITFYDDAIATTPEAAIAGIKSLPRIGTLLLGGQDRGYDFTKLAQVISAYGIPNVILFPESGAKIGEAIRAAGGMPQRCETRDMKEAVEFAYRHTPKGSICLLSSASPSYSLWKNFEEKGDEFKKWVRKLS